MDNKQNNTWKGIIVVLCMILTFGAMFLASVIKKANDLELSYKECNRNYKMLELKINYMIEQDPTIVKYFEAWRRIEANVSQYYAGELIRGKE